MPTARRALWETLICLCLAALAFAAWSIANRRGETRLAEERAARSAEVSALKTAAAEWADGVAENEAHSTFSAFAAGIQPAILSRRSEALTQAKAELLKLDRVVFVHLLSPDGKVLFTSDEKFATRGAADERGNWALEATEYSTRPGTEVGVLEMAAPLLGSAGPGATLWMGYNTASARGVARPKIFDPTVD